MLPPSRGMGQEGVQIVRMHQTGPGAGRQVHDFGNRIPQHPFAGRRDERDPVFLEIESVDDVGNRLHDAIDEPPALHGVVQRTLGGRGPLGSRTTDQQRCHAAHILHELQFAIGGCAGRGMIDGERAHHRGVERENGHRPAGAQSERHDRFRRARPARIGRDILGNHHMPEMRRAPTRSAHGTDGDALGEPHELRGHGRRGTGVQRPTCGIEQQNGATGSRHQCFHSTTDRIE